MMYILDTNVLVRFLVGDHEAHRSKAESWFKEAEQGKREISVTPLVIAEACFVLESCYKKSVSEIADGLSVFISQKWLNVEARNVLLSAMDWYRAGFHFVDSFLAAWARVNSAEVLSFDQKLLKKSKK